MINTILVEDDLYIQKHFVDRLAADGEFHLVGVFRDAFEAEKHCDATVKLVLMDVQTQHKHSGLDKRFLPYFTKKPFFRPLPVYFVKSTVETQRTHDITHFKIPVVFHSFMLY